MQGVDSIVFFLKKILIEIHSKKYINTANQNIYTLLKQFSQNCVLEKITLITYGYNLIFYILDSD